MGYRRFIPCVTTPLRVPLGKEANWFSGYSGEKNGVITNIDSNGFDGHLKQKRLAAISLSEQTIIVAYRQTDRAVCRLVALRLTANDLVVPSGTKELVGYENVEWIDMTTIDSNTFLIRFEIFGDISVYVGLIKFDTQGFAVISVEKYNKGNTNTGGSIALFSPSRGLISFFGINNYPSVIGFSISTTSLTFDVSETEVYDEALENNSPIPLAQIDSQSIAVFWNQINKIQRGALSYDHGNYLSMSSVSRFDANSADYMPLTAVHLKGQSSMLLGSAVGRNISGSNVSSFNHSSSLFAIDLKNQELVGNQKYKPLATIHPMNGLVVMEDLRGVTYGLGTIVDEVHSNILLCPFKFRDNVFAYGFGVPLWTSGLGNILHQHTAILRLSRSKAIIVTGGKSLLARIIRRG